MSQYPSAPPPGPYVPPNQGTPPTQGFTQQQPQYGYQQPQAASPYGPAPTYGPPAAHKSTNAFDKAFNQAVTQGKPMLNKLGKTISSKFGNKHPTQATPQHLESYQNYQQHQQQSQPQSYQAPGQQFSSQPQHQQSVYQTPQQSPFQQSNYGTPASENSGQSGFFAQQAPAHSHQAPQQQPNAPGYSPNMFTQAGTAGGQPQGQPTGMQGQYSQAQSQEGPHPTEFGQASGQQTGVIGGSQSQLPNISSPSPQAQTAAHNPPQASPQPQQWALPPPVSNQNVSPVAQQQPQSFNASPQPPQYTAPPPVPAHPNQRQQQQNWTPVSPVSPHVQQNQIPPSVSPPPPQSAGSQQQPHSNALQEAKQQSYPPEKVSHNAPPQAAPTEFLAELPAEIGNMSILEGSKPQRPPSNPPTQGSAYQAYRPSSGQNQSPGPGFTIPRRAVSTSSLPLADPWRVADPGTELPTREFYIIADLIFDGLDRRCEPQNTGLVEASKVLESWKTRQLAGEAVQLFSYDTFSAFARLWSVLGIPHIMVPCETSLTPLWNFQQQSHAYMVGVPADLALDNTTHSTYIPALNRAGFYKCLFIELMAEPESLEKLLQAFCADTYKPSVLNQPDLNKRDKTELPGLTSRATGIRTTAITRVCQDIAAQMQGAHATPSQT